MPSERFLLRCKGQGYEEQTIRAIRAGLQSSAKGVSLDAHLTIDGHWVIIKGEEAGWKIRKVHGNRRGSLKDMVLPIEDALMLLASLGKKRLILNINDFGCFEGLLSLMESHSCTQRVIISSFHEDVMHELYTRKPSLNLGLNVIPGKDKVEVHKEFPRRKMILRHSPRHTFSARTRPRVKLNVEIPPFPLFSLHLPSMVCTQQTIGQVKDKGLKVGAFTASSRLAVNILERQGVDIILTDKILD